eukprot:3873905-Prymnesium_polylepis.1
MARDRRTPASMPIGYALVSEPNRAPTSRPKCEPSAGVKPSIMVKPSRLRNAAASTASTARNGTSYSCGTDASTSAGRSSGTGPPPAALAATCSRRTGSLGTALAGRTELGPSANAALGLLSATTASSVTMLGCM